MASGGQDKTEAPTPKRLREAREKGQVARSVDLTGAVVLAVVVGVFIFSASSMMDKFKSLVRDGLLAAGVTHQIDQDSVMDLVMDMTMRAVGIIAPLAVAAAIAAVVVGAAQTKFLFSSKALKPQWSRLSPKQGFKRMLGTQGMFELGKALLKMIVIAAVAFLVLKGQLSELGSRLGMGPEEALAFLADLAMQLLISVTLAYFVLAAVDYAYQRYETTKQLKMTKDEVKQEFKQTEGTPEVKAAIRRRQREAAQKRMMADVPTADVVLTNPTHYAVAVTYSASDPAPKVVAKGADLVARNIRRVAEDNDVPIVEDPPLARTLHASCEVGQFVPGEMFVSVAEVLAYVYRLKAPTGSR